VEIVTAAWLILVGGSIVVLNWLDNPWEDRNFAVDFALMTSCTALIFVPFGLFWAFHAAIRLQPVSVRDRIQAVDAGDLFFMHLLAYTRAMRSRRMLVVLLLLLFAEVQPAAAQQVDSHEVALNEYLVVGTVIWTHTGSSSIAVRGSSLLGYLRVRVPTYQVKQPSALVGLRPGDAITAVFSKRDGMLHRVRRVQSTKNNLPNRTDIQ
jgi:hypothetical protein